MNALSEPAGRTAGLGWGRGKAHPDPAEALIIVEALILTRQLPAQRDAELPALHQKQEQGFSTSGILGRGQAHFTHSGAHSQGLL